MHELVNATAWGKSIVDRGVDTGCHNSRFAHPKWPGTKDILGLESLYMVTPRSLSNWSQLEEEDCNNQGAIGLSGLI